MTPDAVIIPAGTVFKQAAEAAKHVARTRESLEEYLKHVDAGRVEKWQKDHPSEKAEECDGVVVSRYRADESKRKRRAQNAWPADTGGAGPRRQDVIDRLERGERAKFAAKSRRRGAVG